MDSLRTLFSHVPWAMILRVLGLPHKGNALPARTTCPFCQGSRLTVYQDNITGSAWHYCFECRQAGDMIELAAKVWDLSPAAAIRKLVKHGIPLSEEHVSKETVQRYITKHPHQRIRAKDFWRRAGEYLVTSGSSVLARLRTKFRLHDQLSRSAWLEGPANLIGGASHLTVEQFFQPNNVNIIGKNPSYRRVFVGPKWTDVLVVPYHDLPGRICGFLFVGRDGKVGDRVYRAPHATNSLQPHSADTKEAGLAGCWSVEASNGMMGDFIIAVNDPMLAIRIQLRHFSTSRIPLPIVAWHDFQQYRTTSRAWQSLERRRPIHWAWRLSSSLLHQAIISNGLLSLAPVEELNTRSIDHYIRHDAPRDLARKIIKRALPWREALAAWAEQMPNGTVEEVILGMDTYRYKPTELMGISDKLDELLHVEDVVKSVTVGQQVISEIGGNTYSNGRLIMNGVLRITGSYVKNDIAMYTGELHVADKTIEFDMPIMTITNGSSVRLSTIAAKANALLYVESRYASQIIKAAIRFGEGQAA